MTSARAGTGFKRARVNLREFGHYYPGTEDPHTSPNRKQGFLACASG
ncbi:MAG: hypothetical protein ABSG53_18480 [Thermoguttaceae bacterium]